MNLQSQSRQKDHFELFAPHLYSVYPVKHAGSRRSPSSSTGGSAEERQEDDYDGIEL